MIMEKTMPALREVAIGIEGDEFVEITSGIGEEDKVLKNPSTSKPE